MAKEPLLPLHLPSPIECITFDSKRLYLKRDDYIHSDFSGNKARKFYYFLTHNFPEIDTIVSYGSAQSNAMYSLSVLANIRGWKFDYYVEHIASYLKSTPHGNYKRALANGMRLHEAPITKASLTHNTLLIEEGGRQVEASYGIALLAQEIIYWQETHKIPSLSIFLPSGTGTTALYLQTALLKRESPYTAHVYTTPCVGDAIYLKKQFFMLESQEAYHPTILTLPQKHHFGKLYRKNYEIWLKLRQETGVVFDLLYDPLGWRTLLFHSHLFATPLLYIHQGGISGNESMLARYRRKYKDIHL